MLSANLVILLQQQFELDALLYLFLGPEFLQLFRNFFYPFVTEPLITENLLIICRKCYRAKYCGIKYPLKYICIIYKHEDNFVN